MHILEHVPLQKYSTMRLGGEAAYLAEITTKEEISEAAQWADSQSLPLIVIGQGSNIVWTDGGFPGLVMVNKIPGFEVPDEDANNLYLTIGAGEVWDSVVERSVEMGLSGLEQLSLIPGTAGATPIQNVGAYGREIAEVLVSVEAFDRQTREFVIIEAKDCNFTYRSSRFRTTDKNRFIITSLTVHLLRQNPKPPFYGSLQVYFDERGISEFTPAVVRQAVIAIRQTKLPDPAQVANNGSFFHNPIVEPAVLQRLQASYPEIVYWPTSDGKFKLSAGWLLEQAGFKGVHDAETGMATWPQQALVLVNEQAHSTADLLKFRQKILDRIEQMFGLTLEQEPELIGV